MPTAPRSGPQFRFVVSLRLAPVVRNVPLRDGNIARLLAVPAVPAPVITPTVVSRPPSTWNTTTRSGHGAKPLLNQLIRRPVRIKVHLGGTKAREGEGKVGETVLLTVLFGSIGLIKHGKNIDVGPGTPLTAYVADDVTFNRTPNLGYTWAIL